MYEYIVEIPLGLENTDYDIRMKKNIIFPFHPNENDELMIYGDVREIESILIFISECGYGSNNVKSCEITLHKFELARKDDDKESIKSLIEAIKEMIIFGWEHDNSYSGMPSLDDDINDIYGLKRIME